MKVAIFAALATLMTISVTNAEGSHRQIGSPAMTCDNDGRCVTGNASGRSYPAGKHRLQALVTVAVDAPGQRQSPALDANGNTVGLVVSHKTGAQARVGVAYAARFQAYIDDLENNYGARVLFMGGIRPGRCSASSQHPCGKALDVCQLRRGGVDPRCNLPGRVTLGQIAAAHRLFEGGRWCQSDYGHAQTDVTAAACGESPFLIVRHPAPDQSTDGPRP